MQIDHIGWITDDVGLFETFWCGVLGFRFKKETRMPKEMSLALFNYDSSAIIRRYEHESMKPDVEIHFFDKPSLQEDMPFWRFGINHICLHTGGPGSREAFVATLPPEVKIHRYDNPKGWANLFIRDLEGNWIELREDLIVDLNTKTGRSHSQFNEDAMIACLVDTLGIQQGWFCELGALDGIIDSNCYALLKKGWHGVMVEGHPKKIPDLVRNMDEFVLNEKVQLILEYITLEQGQTFDEMMSPTNLPRDFDLFSLDIDTYEYWIWASIKNYQPKIVVVEYNSNWKDPITIPYKKDREEWDSTQYFGASASALERLGKHKGYDLVGVSYPANLIFLRSDLNQGRFKLVDLSTNKHICAPFHKEMSEIQKQALIINPPFET